MLLSMTKNGILIIGLVTENIERLRDGKPMKVDPRTYPFVPCPIGIVYGDTELDVMADLKKAGVLPDDLGPIPGSEDIYRPLVSSYRRQAPQERILILTVGLPRSGKSTWAQMQVWPVVNPDSIRLALHGQAFYAPAEPFIWANARLMVRSLFLAGHRTVILDATNTTLKRRQEWLAPREWLCCTKEIATSKEECLERARKDRPDLVSIIERMAGSYEAPGPDEHPWP